MSANLSSDACTALCFSAAYLSKKNWNTAGFLPFLVWISVDSQSRTFISARKWPSTKILYILTSQEFCDAYTVAKFTFRHGHAPDLGPDLDGGAQV